MRQSECAIVHSLLATVGPSDHHLFFPLGFPPFLQTIQRDLCGEVSLLQTRSDAEPEVTFGTIAQLLSDLRFAYLQEVSEIWGPDRVGVRLSPLGSFNDMSDAEPEVTFGTMAQLLSDLRFAYLHIVNPGLAAIEKGKAPDAGAEQMLALIRQKYSGTLIVAGGFDQDTAKAWLEQSKAHLIAFGRKFLANPDLPDRLRMRTGLNADDQSTYYGGGAKGYTDYPSLPQERGEQPKACVDDRWR